MQEDRIVYGRIGFPKRANPVLPRKAHEIRNKQEGTEQER